MNGPDTHELYKYLKANEVFTEGNKPICKEGVVENIPWNFAKFLVDKEGTVTHYFGPKVHPDEIRPIIEKHLLEWNGSPSNYVLFNDFNTRNMFVLIDYNDMYYYRILLSIYDNVNNLCKKYLNSQNG